MPKSLPIKTRKPRRQVLTTSDQWKTIFKDVSLLTLPPEYIGAVKIFDEDGDAYELDVSDRLYVSLDELVLEMQELHQGHISRMDFKINLDKVVKDVTAETSRMMLKF